MGYKQIRRAAIWGTLGLAVVVPMLACTGGDTATEVASNDVTDPKATIQGRWKIFPSEEDLRALKVLNLALDTSSQLGDLQTKLSPAPTAAEEQEYQRIHSIALANPNDVILNAVRAKIDMMKTGEVEIKANRVTLSYDSGESSWGYTVNSAETNKLVLTLDSNETQTYAFDGKDAMRMSMMSNGEPLDLGFKRMGENEKGRDRSKGGKNGGDEGKAGKGGKNDGPGGDGGPGGGGGGGGGGGEGKAGKGGKGGKAH